MAITKLKSSNPVCWFLGAVWATGDQTERFISKGIWENGPNNSDRSSIMEIKTNDRVAIKATYTRKNGLPFNNHQKIVSVMGIKAIGLVKENPGNGKTIKVDWIKLNAPREWYFYTIRKTIWKVTPDDKRREELINFTFNAAPQNYENYMDYLDK